MKLFLRIPDESGDEILIGVHQISTVRYANFKRRGELAIIRMGDGQVFEVRSELFDAELELLEPQPVAPEQPVVEKTLQNLVEVVKSKRGSRKS